MRLSILRPTAALSAAALVALGLSVAPTADPASVEVIARAATTTDAVVADILALGGEVIATHEAVGMVSASLTSGGIAALRADADVASVAVNQRVSLASTSFDDGVGTPMSAVSAAIGADTFHQQGFTGAGIDVALIDSGVARLPEITANLKDGVDVSFDAFDTDRVLRDDYGHGTHLAGIIAGNGNGFKGIAPGAGLVNVKVADRNGVADVTQVIAGIDWVIANKGTEGRNIRVLALAFGVVSKHTFMDDPVAFAIDKAISKGITVVVSAGNRGGSAGGLDMPGAHPNVLAVGASSMNGTIELKDDAPMGFSSAGNDDRMVNGLAPGERILSLRTTGSFLDTQFPAAQAGSQLFRGSGTSQSAAVVAGAAALLLQAKPAWTSADVGLQMQANVARLSSSLEPQTGSGAFTIAEMLDLHPKSKYKPQKTGATGDGSLDGARGGNFVTLTAADGETLTLQGNVGFDGRTWNGSSWNGSSWNGSSWNGSSWNGSSWNGSSWNGSSWNGSSWNASSWNAATWGS